MENKIGIYKITNIRNDKVYIGQSKNIDRRNKDHKVKYKMQSDSNYNKPLYTDMRKYGLDNFSFSILELCSVNELNKLEVFYIKIYKANDKNFGYNNTNIVNNKSVYSKLLDEDLFEIIKLLKETTISAQKIAQKFNVTQATVNYIDKGEIYFNENIKYPIRDRQEILNSRRNEYIAKVQEGIIKPKKVKLVICKHCGKSILSQNKGFCSVECAGLYRRLDNKPSKEELLELILNIPFTKIAEQFNVSSTSITNWCKSYNLPYTKNQIKAYKQALNNVD